MKPKHGATKAELVLEEWDFHSVPQSEIETCFIYEYARELVRRSPRILDLHAKQKTSFNAPEKSERIQSGKALFQLAKIMRNCFPDFPTILLEFNWPDAAWQRVNQKVRSKLVKHTTERSHYRRNRLPYDRLHIQTLRQLEAADVRSLEIFRGVHEIFHSEDPCETEYGFFAVNWSYPNPEIRRAFGQWLSEQRQDRHRRGLREIKYKPRGRGGFRDQLKWLGALRVKEHYSRKQLVNYPYPKLKVAAPYKNLTDLYDSAKKARKLLELLGMAARR